jgi:hypothetical protein
MVMDHYYNPTREHTRKAMEKMPPALTGADPLTLPAADSVTHLAEQLR